MPILLFILFCTVCVRVVCDLGAVVYRSVRGSLPGLSGNYTDHDRHRWWSTRSRQVRGYSVKASASRKHIATVTSRRPRAAHARLIDHRVSCLTVSDIRGSWYSTDDGRGDNVGRTDSMSEMWWCGNSMPIRETSICN